MIQTKLFELRDRATFIPLLVMHVESPQTEVERWLLARAGYGRDLEQQKDFIIMAPAKGGKISYNPYDLGSARTFVTAHDYIREHWDTLNTGDVICVESILGERNSPVTSEREDGL